MPYMTKLTLALAYMLVAGGVIGYYLGMEKRMSENVYRTIYKYNCYGMYYDETGHASRARYDIISPRQLDNKKLRNIVRKAIHQPLFRLSEVEVLKYQVQMSYEEFLNCGDILRSELVETRSV